ncbi:MAG: SDR family oxidoreductase [Chloroflexi bacterium]|nr:SDR family oxidoreductase [Chloroflexota bacterium]
MATVQRTAIVTGAGSGLGRAIALQLAREGRDVACVDLHAATAEQTAADVEALGRRGLAVALDVRDAPAVRAMAEQVRDAWGRIDILVACAGVLKSAPVVELSEADWDWHLDVHAKGTFLCCQAVLPTMMAQRYGRIVTTVSGLAKAGAVGTAAYAAAKGAIVSFTLVLAREAEPYGITVNAFGPGPTDTPLLRGGVPPERMAETLRRAPFGRLPTPEEGAELAVWFTRDATAHITGRIFVQGLY